MHIQAYSGIFSTLLNPRVFTNLRLGIFTIGSSFETCERLTRYIENPVIGHNSAIFRTLHMQKLGILRIQEYSEILHYRITTHIQNPVIFTKIYQYSEL